MSVSNLTGTTWVFNDDLNITSDNTFLINFIDSDDVTYNALHAYVGTGLHLQYFTNYPDSFLMAYATEDGPSSPGSQSWQNQSYKIITITGGQDVTNANLISWIESNAKQLIEYKTDSVEIGSIADAIRAKGGTSASLVYPAGFVSAIEAIESDGNIEDAIVTRTISGTYENSRVTTIGSHAFATANMLTNVSVPLCSVIGNQAFGACGNLVTVRAPLCQQIYSNAFFNCVKLQTADFPSCVSIQDSVFGYCKELSIINFQACLRIGGYAFEVCSNLTSVSFPTCTSIGPYAFRSCSNLTSVSFPACTSIGSHAFRSCSNLTSVSFPACKSIGSYAFGSCYKLISLYLTGSSFVSLANSGAFSSTPIGGYSASAGKYGSIYVPASMLASYKTRTNWTYFSSRMVGR